MLVEVSSSSTHPAVSALGNYKREPETPGECKYHSEVWGNERAVYHRPLSAVGKNSRLTFIWRKRSVHKTTLKSLRNASVPSVICLDHRDSSALIHRGSTEEMDKWRGWGGAREVRDEPQGSDRALDRSNEVHIPVDTLVNASGSSLSPVSFRKTSSTKSLLSAGRDVGPPDAKHTDR